MNDFPLIGLRQFRERLDGFTEPVRVVRTRGDITVLGTWVPAGYEISIYELGRLNMDHGERKVSSKED